MKKQFALMLALASTIGFTSCDDDDDATLSQSVSSTYEGYLDASSAYFSGNYEDGIKFVVTENTDATVNVSFSSATWGDYTFEGAVVADADTCYAIVGAGTAAMASHGGQGTKSEYDCALSAFIPKGSSSSVPTFTISIPGVMGGTTIVFKTGELPVAYNVAGTYTCWLKASSQYFPNGMYEDNLKLSVKAAGEGTAYVTFTSATWGVFEVKAATVTKAADGSFAVSGEGTAMMAARGGSANMSEYDCTVSATVASSKEVVFTFEMPEVMGGTTIVLTSGTLPDEYKSAE